MSSKMLIDASHPEETRVVVTKGNKIEDFDFESEHKKQIRGNIYLAKVTRVEPSLQAAFVEYGGNRHGFLPFSEIHPDYYQIPLADREALMREMAEDLAAEEADEDAADDANGESEGEGQAKSRRRSRRGGRRRKAASAADETDAADEDAEDGDGPATDETDGDEEDAEDGDEPDAFADEDGDTVGAAVETESVSDEPSGEGASGDPDEGKPKRRSTRRRKAPVAAAAESGEASASDEAVASAETTGTDGASAEGTEEAPKPKRRASRRKKATETAAQDAPTEDAPTEGVSEDAPAADAPDGEKAPEETPKPKRRASRRKKAPEAEVEAGTDDSARTEPVAEATVEDLTLNEAEGGDPSTEAAEGTDETGDPTGDEAPKRSRSRRGRGRRAKANTDEMADDTADDASDDASTSDDEAPEETGADDALDEAPRRKPPQRRHYKIQEVIKRRQILLVQVTKEERGNKGAALTTYLSLAGRYSVLMPNTARGGGISRKIAQASDRKRLKDIAKGLDVPDGMGVILRTAAAARSKPEVNRDFEYLMRLWDSVRELTLQSTAPALVYEEGNLIKRSIRDLYNKDMGDIVVAGEEGYREARDFMRMLMPSQAKSVKRWDKPTSMLVAHGVEAELERMMQPQVNLKSGGYIIINQTEALVAIDVNSGRSTREHSIEQTARNTNLEAAEEIARQLRLRDLAGLIVIDFIDMDEKRNNRAVESKLKDCLKNDRARIQLGRISSFGLLEMSRQRMRSSVLEATMRECPHCHGTGYLKSDSSVALSILRATEEQMRKHPDHAVVVRTDAATALSVLNAKRAQLAALEAEHGVPVVLEADATLAHGDVKVERGAFVERRERIERQVRQDRSLMDVVDSGADDDETDTADETGTDAVMDDEDGQESKRRRRGRRGGRNRRGDASDNASDAAEADTPSPEELVSPSEIVVAAVEDGPTEGVTTADASTDAEASEKAPKRRRSSRRKAPVEADVEVAAGDDDNAGAEAEANASDEAPKRRSTRRRKAPVAASVSEGADAPTAVADSAASPEASETGEQSESPSEPDATDRPRRSTRRRKAPVASAPMAAAVTAKQAEADVQEDEANAPASPDQAAEADDGAAVSTRRRSRRVTRPAPGLAGPSGDGDEDRTQDDGELETVSAPAASNDAASNARTDEGGEPDAGEDGAEPGEGKRRKGWWNRGFF